MKEEKFKILYIDDNPLNLEMFEDNFMGDFDIHTHNNPLDAIRLVSEVEPDMVILDVHMPFKNGLDIFKELREDEQTQDIPVMFYSMDDSDETVSSIFMLGPEDFLVRTMSAPQVKARILNRLKKVKLEKEEENFVSCENLQLNTQNFMAYIDETQVQLTSIEYKILYFVLKNRGKTITKDDLIGFVWGQTHVVSRTVNTHMTNLRTKIKDANFQIKINRTNQIRLLIG